MMLIAQTPPPPYFAVIFTSLRTDVDSGYADMALLMDELARQQPGYMGMESARNELGITVSYWETMDAIIAWKAEASHRMAQKYGRDIWYSTYKVRICRVERDYNFSIDK